MLPNFLVVGSARSGTTSLYHTLAQHPDVYMPDRKEPHFFTSQWERGLHWYEELMADSGAATAVGEASVSYTYPQYPDTVQRIVETLPDVRIVYLVRNPIERTYSHYLYYRDYKQAETRPFDQALSEDSFYVDVSRYMSWVQRYLEAVPEERFKVVVFDDFVTSPGSIARALFGFLGVRADFVPPSLGTKTNATVKPRSAALQAGYRHLSMSRVRKLIEPIIPQSARPFVRNQIRAVLGARGGREPMSPSCRQTLVEALTPGVQELSTYLGRDLGHWLNP